VSGHRQDESRQTTESAHEQQDGRNPTKAEQTERQRRGRASELAIATGRYVGEPEHDGLSTLRGEAQRAEQSQTAERHQYA